MTYLPLLCLVTTKVVKDHVPIRETHVCVALRFDAEGHLDYIRCDGQEIPAHSVVDTRPRRETMR